MDDRELNDLVNRVSIDFFNKPFAHNATFNLRLRSTGGRYLTSTHNLEFNKKALEVYGLEELINIIKHELCHYHLHILGKGYRHKDKDFKNTLLQVKGTRYSKPLISNNKIQTNYQLMCKNCKQIYHRKRKINHKKYRCSKCLGKLELLCSTNKNIDRYI